MTARDCDVRGDCIIIWHHGMPFILVIVFMDMDTNSVAARQRTRQAIDD